jgi:hypothetical protein
MSPPARTPRPDSRAAEPELVPDNEKASFLDPFYGLVSARACSLFEKSGGLHDDDASHWLRAERELAASPALVESGDACSVGIRVPGITAGEIKVCITEEKAVVSAKSSSSPRKCGSRQRPFPGRAAVLVLPRSLAGADRSRNLERRIGEREADFVCAKGATRCRQNIRGFDCER